MRKHTMNLLNKARLIIYYNPAHGLKLKINWASQIVGVTDDAGNLIASSLVLIKKLPLGFTMFYTPRGPIMDYENAELVSFFSTN